ncbi:MAG: excinuclease ABC subunit UvrA, partial [Leptospiraceae bacterium]|nr:excinuclease ABC subunit UvrA [Leptospiraceae bacterium]
PVSKATIDEIVDRVRALTPGSKVLLLAPLVQNRKGTFSDLFDKLRKENHVRVRVNGEIQRLDEEIKLARNKKHSIELVVDRLVIKAEATQQSRISQSVEYALEAGQGNMLVYNLDEKDADKASQDFSQNLYCRSCDISLPELGPASFS